MEIVRSDAEDVVILQPRGSIGGFEEAKVLKNKIQEALREGKIRFVLDLSRIDWLSSTGLGAIVGGYKAIREAKGIMCLARANQQVMSLLKMTNLTRAFRLYDTIENAVKFASIYEPRLYEET
jgi:anti-anti-sigma factor